MKKNVFANMRLMITETDENLQSSSLQMPRHRSKSWESEREEKLKKKVLYITQTLMERKNERKRRRTQPTQREREKNYKNLKRRSDKRGLETYEI